MTLIDKINTFESAPVSNVKLFNETFTSTPLAGLSPELEVEIGEIVDSDTTRWLLIGGLTIKHSFCGKKGTEDEEKNEEV